MKDTLHINKDNLENYYQRNDAAQTVAVSLIKRGFGSLYSFWSSARTAYGFTPQLDGRCKEMKALREAEAALAKAMVQYDAALEQARAKEKAK